MLSHPAYRYCCNVDLAGYAKDKIYFHIPESPSQMDSIWGAITSGPTIALYDFDGVLIPEEDRPTTDWPGYLSQQFSEMESSGRHAVHIVSNGFNFAHTPEWVMSKKTGTSLCCDDTLTFSDCYSQAIVPDSRLDPYHTEQVLVDFFFRRSDARQRKSHAFFAYLPTEWRFLYPLVAENKRAL